jgi:reductive dehalogenase
MKLFSRRRRAPHLGPYKMENIKRVARPTTRIDDEAVPRMPKRANFFSRALAGDLGEKARRERPRFVAKIPIARAMGKMCQAHLPLHDGKVAEIKAPIPDDPLDVANHIKSLCYFLDADIVGICEVPDYAWYSHDEDGNEIHPYHKYAIVILVDQGFATLDAASGDDWISNAQSFRGYMHGSTIGCVAADYIRQLGWPARAHTNLDSDVLHIPLILQAGLGELSRIGEVVLNPFLGPRFKSTVITTDLPLAIDQPIDFGLQDFCSKCRKCAVECPCDAIPFGDKVMFNGYEMWKPDVEKCTRYRVTNAKGGGCGRCMKMCPFNKEGLPAHRGALWLAMKFPLLRGLLARMDDWLGYGRRNEAGKWWWDHEYVDGAITAARAVNERDLNPDRKPTPNQKIAIYPADMAPPPDRKEPFPLDRKEGLRRYAAASKPRKTGK